MGCGSYCKSSGGLISGDPAPSALMHGDPAPQGHRVVLCWPQCMQHHATTDQFCLGLYPCCWVCRYVGRLKSNGRVFDKTDKKPFSFRLGE